MALDEAFAVEAFDLADTHQRGWIEEATAARLLNALGFATLSTQERVAFLRSMDPGASGRIDRSEFLHALKRRLAAPDSPEELAEALHLIDTNEAGCSATDLKAVFDKYGVAATDGALKHYVAVAAEGAPVMTSHHWRAVQTKQTSATRSATKY
jgi:Ca2+-binding EF-hand superfamily protein